MQMKKKINFKLLWKLNQSEEMSNVQFLHNNNDDSNVYGHTITSSSWLCKAEHGHVDVHMGGYWALVLMMKIVMQKVNFLFMAMDISSWSWSCSLPRWYSGTHTHTWTWCLSMNKHISKPNTIYTEIKQQPHAILIKNRKQINKKLNFFRPN